MRISDWSSDVCSSDLGYAIVNISLKPIGGIPGDASAEQIDLMADLAERYSFDELRVTHGQNIVLPHVAKRDLHAIWRTLDAAGLASSNLDLISDIIACPGLDYCRSEEHTSELQSLMRLSYAVFCLKTKKNKTND